MANGNPSDVDKALHGMSDQRAIDIMEGRAQPHDSPEIERAARAIAEGLEDEELVDPVPGHGGGGVTPLPVRQRQPQPWLRMAAALLLGVVITSVVAPPTLLTTVERPGISSANVVFLDTYRGAAADSMATVSLVNADPWLTLVGFPHFDGAERLRVYVERAGADAASDWSVIMEDDAGVGTKDSIVVNVPTARLQPGIHRLRIDSEGADAEIAGSTAVTFLVTP